MNPARHKLYKPALLTLAAALLLAVGFLQRELNRQRADPALQLTRVAPLENAPPVLAFTTVALGGFRGLIANGLWIRAQELQDEGKYFEMVQLADWITKLEPTFVHVWLVQAWNMAYNISVKFSDPADRWRWLQRGIELLRDDGLRYNPREALIYRELAWFFQHKMGHVLDDAHVFYKASWAKEMTAVLGSGRPNFDELINPPTEDARRRVELLRSKYKMDPRRMQEVDALYGPLEWRLPEAHAIYWAWVGLKESKKKDLITLRRVIYQSMHMAVLRGRLLLLHENARPLFRPNLELAPQAHAAYEQMIAEDAEMRDAIQRAHQNFLREVVYLLYLYNRQTEAARWFATLRELYPNARGTSQSLEEYALERVAGVITDINHNRTKLIVEGLLFQHFESLALGEPDKAIGLERMARQVWTFYDQKIGNQKERLGLPPIPEMKKIILDQLLDPQSGYPPELAARLRTELNLPPPANPPPPQL